jgi:hypothetical protein
LCFQIAIQFYRRSGQGSVKADVGTDDLGYSMTPIIINKVCEIP